MLPLSRPLGLVLLLLGFLARHAARCAAAVVLAFFSACMASGMLKRGVAKVACKMFEFATRLVWFALLCFVWVGSGKEQVNSEEKLEGGMHKEKQT